MVWFFARESESLKIETTHDRLTGTFTLDTFAADGTRRTERFASEAAFDRRLKSIEAELRAEHWTSLGGSVLPTLGEPS